MDFKTDTWYMHPAIAAAAGALLGLKAMPGTTWWAKASNLVTGFLVALFVGPWLVEALSVTNTKIGAGIIFAAGAAGLVLFGAIIDGIKQTPAGPFFAAWLDFLKPRRSGGNDPGPGGPQP